MMQFLDAKIEFATLEEGRSHIGRSDVYTENLTDFDLRAKIRTSDAVTEAEYLSNAKTFVRAWRVDEVAYLSEIIAAADRRARKLCINVSLPEEIVFVKTTGFEEGGANGYTRENAIYLNRNSFSRGLVLHEIFHVISRTNPDRTTEAYAALGFKPCNEIDYPSDLRITNPDAPFLRHYMTASVNGQECDLVMIMRASRPYSGGGFFGYVRKKLLVVEGDDDNKTVRSVGGREVLVDHREVVDLYDNIGRNTSYNIHQEEVTAVHFEMLMEGRRPIADPSKISALHEALK